MEPSAREAMEGIVEIVKVALALVRDSDRVRGMQRIESQGSGKGGGIDSAGSGFHQWVTLGDAREHLAEPG